MKALRLEKRSDPWLMALRSVIAVFVLTRMARNGESMELGLLVVLGILSFSTMALVFREPWSLFAAFVSCALPPIAMTLIDPAFACSLPLEWLCLLNRVEGRLSTLLSVVRAVLFAIPFLALSFIPETAVIDFLLCAAVSYLGFFMARTMGRTVSLSERQNAELRDEHKELKARLDRSKDYERQARHLGQLEERNELSQRIHDRVGHAIAGSLLQLEAVEALLARGTAEDTNSSRDMLRRTREALRNGMEDIRALLHALKPQTEDLGIHRLQTMLDQFSSETQMDTELRASGDLSAIKGPQWGVMADNLREFLTNTAKYGRANKVFLNIEILHRLTKIEMRDDGLGAVKVSKGLGLRGMEERTEALNGSLVVDGSRGFSVIMLFPREAET